MPVRAAVVQAASVAFDRERTLAKAEGLVAEAAGRGAQIVVFPEAFVSGYPRGITFGTVVGQRTPEGRDHFRRYFDSAVDVPGPDVQRLGAMEPDPHVRPPLGTGFRALDAALGGGLPPGRREGHSPRREC